MNTPSTVSSSASLHQNSAALRGWLAVILAFLGVLGLIAIGQNIDRLTFVQLSDIQEVNQRFSYQFITVGMTLVYLLIVYAMRPEPFRLYARLGDIGAPASPVAWLDIKATDSWRKVGLNFGVVVTLATSAYLYFNLIQPQAVPVSSLIPWLPIAVALAVMNAFVEEALTRFGVAVGLHGVVPNRIMYLVSALVFGVPHFFGVPGGPVGALMAGFLGWLLARSIVDTRGVFWAWFLHFVQDIVIFTVLLSVLAV